mmetsp:Transcript_10970/g.9704  ORF Transcript_10970/g.9704 Transcript_10970/m.9704 type:complete len:118 (-) Transcript_10970:21-374(-)
MFEIILEKLKKNPHLLISSQHKSTRGLHNGRSRRRSKFIGVLGSRTRWQSLINVGNKKTYIGTYKTEKQAALAYDIFALGMHFQDAKTNFTYNSENLIPLIHHYFEADGKICPEKFI